MKETMRKNEIEIPVEKAQRVERLSGTIFVPEGDGPYPGVLFCHGKASSRNGYLPIGEELAENGIAALAFDFSSDSIPERQEDADAAFFLLKNHPQVDKNSLGVLGVSMGAYQAAILAVQQRVTSLALRAPAAYPMNKSSFSIMLMENFKGNLLVVKSEHDEIVPHHISNLYFESAANAKIKEMEIIKGVRHWLGKPDSPYRQEFKEIIVDWFAKTLKATGPVADAETSLTRSEGLLRTGGSQELEV